MSTYLHFVESALLKIINDPNLRAATLTGGWGVGKTFFIHRFAAERKGDLDKAKRRFAYVSMFGPNSLAEVRAKICASQLEFDGGDTPGLHKKAFAFLMNLRLRLNELGGVDMTGAHDVMQGWLERRLLKNLFVCIDDVERRSKEIPLRDLLGLISELTEEHQSRCVCIFDPSKLIGDVDELSQFEEKVFDLTISFHPQPADVVALAISKPCDVQAVLPVLERFKCANIRIMRRIAWVISELSENGGTNVDRIRPLLATHASVLVILKFEHGKGIPEMRRIVDTHRREARLFFRTDKEETSEDVIFECLRDLAFEREDFDEQILDLLNNGSVDAASLVASVDKTGEDYEKRKVREKRSTIWAAYRDNLRTPASAFSSQLKSFLRDHAVMLEPREVVEDCALLLRLETTREVIDLVRSCISRFVQGIAYSRREEVFREFPAIISSDLLSAESIPHIPPPEAPLSLLEAFQRLGDGGLRLDDIDAIADAPVERIAAMLLEYSEADLFMRIRVLISKAENEPRKSVLMREKMAGALDEIAKRDALHADMIRRHLKWPRESTS